MTEKEEERTKLSACYLADGAPAPPAAAAARDDEIGLAMAVPMDT